MQRNMEPDNHGNVDLTDRRANALRKLEKLRMKRREEVPRGGSRQRPTRIPIPPTPPAREVDPSKLTFLFEKRLKYSDTKDEGRIVVPKSFAEKFMPALEAKEGFFMFMDDMTEVKVWRFRYRFWPNNSSRVYVLENTTEFVRARELRIGDFMMIYKDNETQRFAIGVRRSTDDTSGQSGSSSSTSMAVDDQNFHANQQSAPAGVVMRTSSSYSDDLQDFPMDLLNMADMNDLPEF